MGIKLKSFLVGFSLVSFASIANECLQSPLRTNACPNLIYRVGQLPQMEKPAMLCICKSDFEEYLNPPEDETLLKLMKINKIRFEQELGYNIETVLKLLGNI